MILFQCDYNEGAHPKVMEKMLETNMEQTPGYGEDAHCRHAAELIRKACGDDTLAVHFLVGGTQANMTVIDAALRSHQGVVSAQSGHINVHEPGRWNHWDIRCFLSRTRTASWMPARWSSCILPISMMIPLSIRCSRKWFTYPILRNTGHFIAGRKLRI